MVDGLPNGDPGADPNAYARDQLDKGRDIRDIVSDLGLGGGRDGRDGTDGLGGNGGPSDVQMHAMAAELPNGDPAGPSQYDQRHMLDAAAGVTQGSIDMKAGGAGVSNGRALSAEERAFQMQHPSGGEFHLGDPQGDVTAANATPMGGFGGGLPNGSPGVDPHQITRLGDQAPMGRSTMPDGHSWDKTTYDFRQGEYTPGKGVADKDGYFDPDYHSEANILNNARNGDPSAYAKLEVMARAGNTDAAKVMADLGSKDQFMGSRIHADFQAPHNKEINTELAGGAYKGNVEARLNLADQRENFLTHLETTRQSNPNAADMMEKLASIGGRQVNFDSEGVTWVDLKDDEHRVPIGRIGDMLPQLDRIIAEKSKAAAEEDAAYEATRSKRGAAAK